MSEVKPVCLTLGVYDGMHLGHVRMLRHIRQLYPQHQLVVGLCTDEFVIVTKDKHPMNTFDVRMEMISPHCDAVISYGEERKFPQYEIFVHGPDISHTTLQAVKSSMKPGAEIVSLPRHGAVSSSKLRTHTCHMPRVAIDFHDTISAHPGFFKAFFLVYPSHCIWVLTGTPVSQKAEVVRGLRNIGIKPHMYADVLCGFEYDTPVPEGHFERMAQHKYEHLKQHEVDLYIDDNPVYVDYMRNRDITVLQMILSDRYLDHWQNKHPFFTANLQRDQFQYLKEKLQTTTPSAGCGSDPEPPCKPDAPVATAQELPAHVATKTGFGTQHCTSDPDADKGDQ